MCIRDSSSTLAEPLIREVFRSATKAGGHVEIDLDFREKNRIFLSEANDAQLQRIPPLYKMAMETFVADRNTSLIKGSAKVLLRT